MTTVAQALDAARAMGIDRLDAHVLLSHQLQRPREWLIAHDDVILNRTDQTSIATLMARRAAGEPLAYLVGRREFHGLSLHVTPDVLVPRPDTETLVDWAIDRLADMIAPRVLDLGTGSGAVALAIKHACYRAQIHGSDASPLALDVARGNGERLRLPVTWHLGDWWLALDPAMRFDLVVTNPPYVAPGDPHLRELRHEPRAALVAHGNGLTEIERIIAGTPNRLRANGWLLIEHGFDQASTVCECLLRAGFSEIATHNDLADRPRVSGGRLMPNG
jgi:release factor glutamine methyltransferase